MNLNSRDSFCAFESSGKLYAYASRPKAAAAGLTGVARLPYALKIALENPPRLHAAGAASADDVLGVARSRWRTGSTRSPKSSITVTAASRTTPYGDVWRHHFINVSI